MPNPKKRKTVSDRNKRRSHHALKPVKLGKCEKCGADKMPHRACAACGYYKGRDTKKTAAVKPAAKKETKTKAKAAKPKKEEKKG